MARITFPSLVEQEEKFWKQMDMCYNPGSTPEPVSFFFE